MNKKLKPSKEEKTYQNILRVTQQFMEGKGYIPLTAEELLVRLSLPSQHFPTLIKALQQLITQGSVDKHHDKYTFKESNRNALIGTMHAHARGFGFVQPDDQIKHPQDIFIPKQMMAQAVDGDRVEVLILNRGIGDKGPEGRVLTIVERGRTHIAGIVWWTGNNEVLAYAPLLGNDQRISVRPPKDRVLVPGDRIVMEVIDWGSKETETVVQMTHFIGHISDASCDIAAAVEEYELRNTFPKAAADEAKAFGNQVKAKEIANREDFREMECVTIDPDTAKDFDDAITLVKDNKGFYHLGVHIADVSHYVRPGSALDNEAVMRCNSVYFPGKAIPMLPEELSSHLCSLKPEVNRLTVSVMVTFDSNGNQVNYRVCRSVIRSAKRFTYKEAKQVIDGKKKSPHADLLKLMVELCGLLKRKRYERGSIEFALPELVILVDDKGAPTGTDYVEYDITHQMIEEFMLKANEVVAKHLSDNGKNVTYRIHEEPSADDLKDFSSLANVFGFRLPEQPSPAELQTLFDEAIRTPFGQYLATSYIRRMKMAYYSPENVGHYGLSLEYYCHFTSPIRRYVDIVAHRVLFGEDDNIEKLQAIADACSDQERVASKAENSVTLLKKLRLLDAIHTKDPEKQFEAIVTQVKPFGVAFDVVELMLDGFLHVSELESDYFVFEENNRCLRGRHRGIVYRVGDKITLMLKEVNLIGAESKWNMVAGAPVVHRTPVKPSASSKPARRPSKSSSKSKKTTHGKAAQSKPARKTDTKRQGSKRSKASKKKR